jgi:hypothetical protein
VRFYVYSVAPDPALAGVQAAAAPFEIASPVP